jgi:fucose permease
VSSLNFVLSGFHQLTASSLRYGATFAGWVVAAVTNTHLCQYLDVGLVLILGTSIQLIAHVLRVWLPPFGLFVVTFFLAALGQAYNDAQTNAFMSAHKGAHRWLAVVHASFMGGCLVGPFVATAVATATAKGVVPGTTPPPLSTRWYLFYTFPVGLSVLSLVIITWAFRDRLALKTKSNTQAANYAEQGETRDDTQASRSKNASSLIRAALSRPSVWLLGMFYFFYLGSQITLNGWVVEYLVEVREGDLAKMGFVPAGFNVQFPPPQILRNFKSWVF